MLFALLLSLQPVDCSDQFDVKGRYANTAYGFEITFPPEIVGRWNSAMCVFDGQNCVCMSDHGRIAELPGGGWIEAYAGYTTAEGIPLSETARDRYEDYGVDDHEVVSVRQRFFRPTRVGGIAGFHYQVEYRRKGKSWIRDEVDLRDGGVDFALIFGAPKDSYARYAPMFEAVVRSWKRTDGEE